VQKPFQVTEEMINEVNDEIAALANDSTGAGTGPKSFLRRAFNPVNSEVPEPVAGDNPRVPPEDPINPSHYRKHPSGIECIEITRHMSFNLGNAFKYIWRMNDKGQDPVEELKKAQWYIDDEIKRLSER
jgi:hypothetical protein